VAKTYIYGQTLEDRAGCKQACLKVYRDSDQKELSISFDNSLGAFKEECRRIEACIFSSRIGGCTPEQTSYIANSNDLAKCIVDFVLG
jgi:hypothetical protein